MIEIFLHGGLVFMLPLLALSVFVVAIGIERVVRFRRAAVDYGSFVEPLERTLRESGISAARAQAEETPGPVARVWSEGLRFARMPQSFVRERMEAAALRELERLEQFLPELFTTAQIAPLIGILGTVCGLIISFQAMESSLLTGTGLEGGVLTGGIWKALVNTAGGLVVALPALALHHFLQRRVQRFASDMDRSIGDLLSFLALARATAGPNEARTTAARAAPERTEVR